ncbi:MAG: AMP-binding protein [Acidimicrobiia bacterium]|nr:MAG: AMP-binding protein [Acidimicrobiia bacterium]
MYKTGDVEGAAWHPNERTTTHANVVGLMEKHGFSTYSELYRWSVSDADGFWGDVIESLDIAFAVPPTSIRGRLDPMDPDWLPDAEMNIVASCLDHDADAVAVISGGPGRFETVTVGELSSLVAGFAAGFARAGFVRGDAVAIVMPMNLEAVVAYLGVISAGGVVVSIADSFAPPEIAKRLHISEAVAVVTQSEAVRMGKTLAMYQKCIDADAPKCIVVDGDDLRGGDTSWNDFAVAGAVFEPVTMSARAYSNILFSSGTTGDPKAIPWTHTTPIKAAMDGRFHQDIHGGDVVAWPTNLGWVMGPWLIYASLLNGAAMALYDDAPTTRGFVEFVEDAGVTMLGLVPSIVTAWRTSGTLRPGDWTSVRVLSSTGETSIANDSRWLMGIAGDVPLIEYCGGTEIGGGYVTSTVLHPSVPGFFSTPALGLDMVLIDDNGREADIGEVFLVPPSIGLSTELLNRDHAEVYYAGVPDIGKPLRRHGDQMSRDSDGYFRALGRVDDTMNLGGIKVSSAELEGAVSDTDGVAECAAVAVPRTGGGPDQLVVFVVADKETSRNADDLLSEMQSRIRARINPLFKVHDVVLIDALPRTASHKVMRRTLRSDYQPSDGTR